jgi:asparagine synthase (glutamine-hydrolysing)
MCGIGAYISRGPVGRDQLYDYMSVINKSQSHRGPDSTGICCDSHMALCHTRLSIIDLSANGGQPFTTEDGNYTIVYNGELYNFPGIREELEARGYTFKSKSDTEVILKAYVEWGPGTFARFDGMFAFAIYDRPRKKLVLARDRMGIKFIHYYSDDHRIIIASEIKAILELLGKVDYRKRAVDDILLFGEIEGSSTIYEGVKTLEPGAYAEIDLETFECHKHFYFRLLGEISPAHYASVAGMQADVLVDQLDRLLRKSVKMHLISDAPLGCLCSGGVDSSLITAIAHEYNPDISIYHAGVEGGGGEEKYARIVADYLDIDINYIYMSREKYLADLTDVTYHLDKPMYHPSDVSLYNICNKARSQGTKVLLCGEGADELFGGYSWQKDFITSIKARKIIGNGKFVKLLKSVVFGRLDMSAEGLDSFVTHAGLYQPMGYKGNNTVVKSASLLLNNGENLERWNAILDRYGFNGDICERCGNAIILDNLLGHLSTILYRTDRMGMMSSIENRVPFLENDIIRFAMNLPLKFKIRGRRTKWLLKRVAERYLPREVIYRKKIGFPVPWYNYLRYEDDLFKDGFVSSHLSMPTPLMQRVTNDDPEMLLRFVTLEIWGRLFIYRENRDRIKSLLTGLSESRISVPAPVHI